LVPVALPATLVGLLGQVHLQRLYLLAGEILMLIKACPVEPLSQERALRAAGAAEVAVT
jgi:hypothetical protein